MQRSAIHVSEWVPRNFAAVWSRLPVEFQALLWWCAFNLLGEAQLPVKRQRLGSL
jgi:hypothetical protein